MEVIYAFQTWWKAAFSFVSWSSALRAAWSWSDEAARHSGRIPDVKCKKPFLKGLLEAGCGQCLPCRINRQRLWTIRLILEAGQHQESIFATFTYDDEHLPSDGSVSVPETRLLLNRIRKAVGPFRYFIVGEYGERSWRPHYHAILFGVRDRRSVESCWTKGFVHLSGVGPESVGYVAGYCLKGGTSERGMRWLGKSLRPEFARMSLKPGIGAAAAEKIASFITASAAGSQFQTDVPSVVRQSQKRWPLGRYLKGRVIELAGIDREYLSRCRQLEGQSIVKCMSEVDRLALIEQREGVRAGVAHRAEQRYRRKQLERKL